MPKQLRIRKTLRQQLERSFKRIGIKRSQPINMYITEEVKKEIKDNKTINMNSISQRMAEEFADDLKRIISRQVFAWVPLSPKYKERKKYLGLDPRILIATGTYINSIQAMQNEDGTWTVGVPPTPLSPTTKYTLQDLASWLEWGTKNMPPRPHWRPAMVIWKTKIQQVKQTIKFTTTQMLRQRGYT